MLSIQPFELSDGGYATVSRHDTATPHVLVVES
jgi:hypothetical protein